MKALTIWQPWASLLVSGRKKYETRSWATSYRGPIAIHAAKRPVRQTIDVLVADRGDGWTTLDYFDSLFPRSGELDHLPTGAIVGTALLTRCHLITEDFVAKLTPMELALGDFTLGRYAWEFHGRVPVNSPIPAKGMQGLWELNLKEEMLC